MDIKRKRLVIILSSVLSLVLFLSAFGITYSFLTDRDSARNKFSIGETITTIDEEFTPPKVLTPGTSFTKKPRVENLGNLPCYVRMRADFSDNNMQRYCDELDINTTDWKYDSADGYYYYNKLLEPGEKTSPLFTKVTIKTTLSDGTVLTDAQMKDFEILVYAESQQHIDHSGAHTANEYKEIWK